MSRALWGLATVAQMQGDADRAGMFAEQSLALNRELGNKGGVAQSLDMLGTAARLQGNYGRARALHTESFFRVQAQGERTGMACSLAELGKLAAVCQRPHLAATLLGAASDLYLVFCGGYPSNRAEFDATLDAVHVQLGEQTYEAAYAEGRTMTLEQAMALALETLDT